MSHFPSGPRAAIAALCLLVVVTGGCGSHGRPSTSQTSPSASTAPPSTSMVDAGHGATVSRVIGGSRVTATPPTHPPLHPPPPHPLPWSSPPTPPPSAG